MRATDFSGTPLPKIEIWRLDLLCDPSIDPESVLGLLHPPYLFCRRGVHDPTYAPSSRPAATPSPSGPRVARWERGFQQLPGAVVQATLGIAANSGMKPA